VASNDLSLRRQISCTTCGFVFLGVLFIGLFGTSALPPQSPNFAPDYVVGWLSDHRSLKLTGFAVTSVAIGLVMPLVTAISMQMSRVEGRFPVLSVLQFAGGLVTWVTITISMVILCVAAFRLERDQQMTQFIVDFGWLLLFFVFSPFVMQQIAIALVVFSDRSPNPVFPRWLGYFNIWVALLFTPVVVMPFFKVGPFAYDGLLGFWIPTFVYGAWALGMAIMTRRAIYAQIAAEEPIDLQRDRV